VLILCHSSLWEVLVGFSCDALFKFHEEVFREVVTVCYLLYGFPFFFVVLFLQVGG
jgi:hypothetical protein